jgi:hypothetical protein
VVAFKDLQKLVSYSQSQRENTSKELFQRLQGKPFWIWNIDGANPSFIRSLKLQIGEEADYDKVIARCRSEGLGGDGTQDMKIVPVNFKSEHKAMLGHCKMILEKDGGRIAINPDKFDKLITALRTAADNHGTLDKESTSYNDIFDAFRLALKFYHFEEIT